MKSNLDDPNLTAYALGELPETERTTMKKAVAESAEAQAFVQETQQLARLLKQEFRAELDQVSPKPLNIMPLPGPRSFWSDARWLSLGVAALLALGAVIAAVILSRTFPSPRVPALASATPPAEVQMELMEEQSATEDFGGTPPVRKGNAFASSGRSTLRLQPSVANEKPPLAPYEGTEVSSLYGNTTDADAPTATYAARASGYEKRESSNFSTAGYDHFEENPFLPATTNPLSTFSLDVDTASYANVRRLLNSGAKPPKGAVRIEEMVNYFAYDYPKPQPNEPFSIKLDLAGCPWQPDHQLVRIGLKAREIADDQRGASNLVFLLDVSGSMQPAERLPLIKQSMRLLVDRLTENDRVAIVVYAGGTGVALPSTTGNRKEEIFRALEDLQAGGSTNGAAGIELAYKIAAENFIKGGVNRVILATDGDFNVGITSQDELVRLAEEKAKSGVFLSVLGVGTDNLKDSTMQKLADRGNGNYAYLDSLDEARKVLIRQMNGTLVTIAKDVKVQVEFNPARVASYRLLGYEKRMLRKEDFNNDKIDAGEIGAGHTVTALYEIVPAGARADLPVDPLKYQTGATAPERANSDELLTVKLRYKEPEGEKSALLERSLGDDAPAEFASAPADFRFAAAVAEFGMILRDSPHKGNGTLGAVAEWAMEAKGRDEAGYRAGFIELVRKAQAMPL